MAADGSFVYNDPATLDYPKTDYEVRPDVPTSQKIPADHWNRLSKAVDDLRFAVRSLIAGGSALVVTHTSTGSDGTDFTMAIGATMSSTSYGVFWVAAGGTSGDGHQISSEPVIDIPAVDRTTTTFRFTSVGQMAAGDAVQFVVVGVTLTAGVISGNGTPGILNTIPKFVSGTALANSTITDDGTNVTVTNLVATNLRSPVEADPFGGGTNMPAGVINDYTDAHIATQTVLRWKGADNQGTILTGINATGIAAGTLKIFWNQPELGLQDTGTVVFRHQDTGSSAANRFVLEHEKEYIVASGTCVILMYGDDSRWHVAGNSGWAKHVVGQAIHTYPPLLVGFTTPVAGTFNDWNPVGDPILGVGVLGIVGSNLAWRDHSLVLVNVGAAGIIATGLFATTAFATDPSNYSPIKFVHNTGTGPLTFRNNDSASLVQNRISLPGNVDMTLMPYESAIFTFDYYTGGQPQWHCLGVARSDSDIAVSPSALPAPTSTTENWNPGNARRIRVTPDAAGSLLGGLVGRYGTNNASCGYGERRVLHNIGAGPLILLHQSAGSSAANRFYCPGAKSFSIPPQGMVEIVKDDSNQWEVLTAKSPTTSITAVSPNGATNNWNPVDSTSTLSFQHVDVIRMAGSGGPVTGLVGTTFGDRKLIVNYTGTAVVFKHRDAGSSAANQFQCPGAVDYSLGAWKAVWVYYDSGSLWFFEGA